MHTQSLNQTTFHPASNRNFLAAYSDIYFVFDLGPPRIPWFGSYLLMLILDRHHLHLAINRICKFYNSTCIGLYIGDVPTIVLNDHENVKKALVHRDFDGKADILLVRLRDPDFGLYGIVCEFRIQAEF